MSASSLRDELIATKANCKKFVNLTNHYSKAFYAMFTSLLSSWKVIETNGIDMTAQIDEAFNLASEHRFTLQGSSEYVGKKSYIKEKVEQRARTYTNKKGIKKTTDEKRSLAHFDEWENFIGWVAELGPEPIYYTMGIIISRKSSKWIGVGKTLEECFELLPIHEAVAANEALDTKALGRSERREKRKEMKAEITERASVDEASDITPEHVEALPASVPETPTPEPTPSPVAEWNKVAALSYGNHLLSMHGLDGWRFIFDGRLMAKKPITCRDKNRTIAMHLETALESRDKFEALLVKQIESMTQ